MSSTEHAWNIESIMKCLGVFKRCKKCKQWAGSSRATTSSVDPLALPIPFSPSLTPSFALLDRLLDMHLPFLSLVHALHFPAAWCLACGCAGTESDETKSCLADHLVEGNPVGFASTDTFRPLALSHPKQPLPTPLYSLDHAYGHDACGAVCLGGCKRLPGPCAGASAGKSLVAGGAFDGRRLLTRRSGVRLIEAVKDALCVYKSRGLVSCR